MKTKVLLTGATGFLGSHLLNSFLSKKFEVVILTRSKSDLWRIEKYKNKIINYNIDNTTIQKIFEKEKPGVVVHTACSYGRSNETILDISNVNVYFGLDILKSAIKFNCQLFINTDTLLPKGVNNYSLTKAQFRDLLKTKKKKINIANIKIEHMYGPMDDSSKFLVWLVKEMLNERNQIINLTSGIQKRDFLYIDDVVEVFNLIINNKNNLKGFNEYEVGTGVLTTVKDFVFKVANHIENKTNLKIISKLNFGYFPYRNNEIMEPELNNSKLVQLGWIPKFDLEKGLKKTLKEYL